MCWTTVTVRLDESDTRVAVYEIPGKTAVEACSARFDRARSLYERLSDCAVRIGEVTYEYYDTEQEARDGQ